jgi:Ca-activated chloride channel family protein
MKVALYSIVVSLFLIQAIDAQVLVKGVISDETGIPLPGASIIEKGTVNGVRIII